MISHPLWMQIARKMVLDKGQLCTFIAAAKDDGHDNAEIEAAFYGRLLNTDD